MLHAQREHVLPSDVRLSGAMLGAKKDAYCERQYASCVYPTRSANQRLNELPSCNRSMHGGCPVSNLRTDGIQPSGFRCGNASGSKRRQRHSYIRNQQRQHRSFHRSCLRQPELEPSWARGRKPGKVLPQCRSQEPLRCRSESELEAGRSSQ